MRRVVVVLIALVAGCGDDGGGDDDGAGGPELVVPAIIPLPYVAAGMGATSLDITVENPGTADTSVTWQLTGDAGIAIVAAPDVVPAGGDATLTIAWAGAPEPRIAATVAALVDFVD